MNELTYQAPTRRDFAQALALLAAGAVATAEGAPPDAAEYADALETVIRYRFGKELTDEQIAVVKSDYLNQRRSDDLVKRAQLTHDDDPISAFRADLP